MLMLVQRGVDLPSLDVTYFTSLSYYILLLFGLRGVFMLFFRENTIDETQMYRQQMGMGGANPMAAMTSADPNKALEAERAALEMVGPDYSHIMSAALQSYAVHPHMCIALPHTGMSQLTLTGRQRQGERTSTGKGLFPTRRVSCQSFAGCSCPVVDIGSFGN